MLVTLDTNVLAYAEGINGEPMQKRATRLLARLPGASVVIPVQALGELYNVLVRKANFPKERASATVLSWRDGYALVDTSSAVLMSAIQLSSDHPMSIWDAVMLSAAAESGCRLFLSEDLHSGFTWRGLTVVNPFAEEVHPLLAAILEDTL